MTDEIVHIAGPVVGFGSAVRQRCSWCGALIDEKDLARVAVEEESRPPERQGQPLEMGDLAWWEVGGLVGVSGTFPRVSRVVEPELSEGGAMPDGTPAYKAPERSCMRLFEGLEVEK